MSTTLSTCGISFGTDILIAGALWLITAPGGPLSLVPIQPEDPIFGGEKVDSLVPRFFACGRITALNYFVHFIVFIALFTLYRVLKGYYWEECQN
jgi:hypothetical protein